MSQESTSIDEIIKKVEDRDKLPTYNEAYSLLRHVEEQVGPWSTFCKYSLGVSLVYTVEFVDGLSEAIKEF